MDILTELFLFSPEFPIQKVFDEIGIDEGEISVLDAATYSTLSGEQFVREKEMSITYSISINGYDGVEKSTLQLTDMLFYNIRTSLCKLIWLNVHLAIVGLLFGFSALRLKCGVPFLFDHIVNFIDLLFKR